MGFSISEISEILPHFDNHTYLERALRTKMAEVRTSIEAEQGKLNLLMKMSDTVRKEKQIMVYEVELKKLPSIKVLTLRGTIPSYSDESLLWEKLGRHIGEKQIPALGSGYSTYFD